MFRTFFQGGRLTGVGQFLFTFLFTAGSYHFFMEAPDPPVKIRDWLIFAFLILVAISVIFFHIRGLRYERHIRRYLIERILQLVLLFSAIAFLLASSYNIYKISVSTPL